MRSSVVPSDRYRYNVSEPVCVLEVVIVKLPSLLVTVKVVGGAGTVVFL